MVNINILIKVYLFEKCQLWPISYKLTWSMHCCEIYIYIKAMDRKILSYTQALCGTTWT